MSDPTRTIASPHSAILNDGDPAQPPSELLELIADSGPTTIVLGIPLEMDGTSGPMAEETRRFGRKLADATGVDVIEWDERLTSARARETIRETALSRSKRREKGREDMLAAAHLLRGFLDSQGRAAAGGAADPEAGSHGDEGGAGA